MATRSPARIIAELVKEDALKRHGLNSPEYKVAMTAWLELVDRDSKVTTAVSQYRSAAPRRGQYNPDPRRNDYDESGTGIRR